MDALALLSDAAWQRRAWVEDPAVDPAFPHHFWHLVGVVLDDLEILLDPERWIGAVLVDGDEVDALQALGRALDPIVTRSQTATAVEIIEDPAWPRVVDAARTALAAMVRDGAWRADALRWFEPLSSGGRYGVARRPGRRFPGLVVQGDTLSTWVVAALDARDDPDELEGLLEELGDALRAYATVVSADPRNDGKLPFPPALLDRLPPPSEAPPD